MGLFDKLKKKAQEAIGSMQAPEAAPERESAPAPAPRARAAGPTFEWDGDSYPMPSGWANLSMEDWFLKLEQARDRLMNVDEEDLEPMNDEDGEPLDPEEVLLRKMGFQSGHHWECFRSWGAASWAQKAGKDVADFEFHQSGIAREKVMAQKAGAMRGGAPGTSGGALNPVEGVSVEQWAQIQAALAGGGDLNALLQRAGMDRAKWDRVSNEWMARMQTDTSMAIANVYGNAFAGAAQGQYGGQAAHAAAVGVGGDLGPEPISYERFCEITVAQSAASDRGEDPAALLASFGLKIIDWSNIGMYWSKRSQQEMTKYHQLYIQYTEKYEKKYRR